MLSRRALALTAILAASLLAGAPANAAGALTTEQAGQGLEIVLRGEDPLKPAVVLTNRSAQACHVIGGTTLGTVALTKVQQDGADLAPVPLRVSFPDGLQANLKERLQTLEPGAAINTAVAMAVGPDRVEVQLGDGTAGQKVFVDIPSTTMSSQCGALDLHTPDGAVLTSGCVLNNTGLIDAKELPVTGKYTITVTPREASVTQLRLITITDQTGTLSPNGPPVKATFSKPGVVARFTFTATAGQRVFIDITGSTLPSQCGGIDLYGSGRHPLTGGCITGAAGGIVEHDGYVLPETGTYTVVLDPSAKSTGSANVALRLQ
jgi:hypothetical protein